MRESESPSDDPAVSKEFLDLIRVCGRADVEVFRPPPEQQVAHTAAHQVRGVIELLQAVEHLERVWIDVASGEGVLGPGHGHRVRQSVILPRATIAT